MNDEQKAQYDRLRAFGVSHETAMRRATPQDAATTFSLDAILKAPITVAQDVVDSTKDYAERDGAASAALRLPLTVAAAAGRSIGRGVGATVKAADDATGNAMSSALAPVAPVAQDVMKSQPVQALTDVVRQADSVFANVPSDLFDASALSGIGGLAKSAPAQIARNGIKTAARELPIVARAAVTNTPRTLAQMLNAKPLQAMTDAALVGAQKAAAVAQKIPDALSTAVKDAKTRQLTTLAKEAPEAAKQEMVDLFKRSIVPGVKKKKKSLSNVEATDDAITRLVPTLAKKYEVQDIDGFARAVDSEKKDIWTQIDSGLKTAGQKGKTIDLAPVVKQLDEILKSERANFSPELTRAAENLKRILIDKERVKTLTPLGAQDIIADLNAELRSHFRGSTSGTNADVVVKQMFLNNLKQSVDDVVEQLDGKSFKQLKSQYADLKKIEEDVVHRAIFEAQKGAGLAGLTDIMSAADIFAGVVDPTFLVRGVGQYVTKEVIIGLNNKDELVRQLFILGKNIKDDGPVKKLKVVPQSR